MRARPFVHGFEMRQRAIDVEHLFGDGFHRDGVVVEQRAAQIAAVFPGVRSRA
jgi:hypothetical protein